MSLNLAMILREAARTRPDEAAVLFDDRELHTSTPARSSSGNTSP